MKHSHMNNSTRQSATKVLAILSRKNGKLRRLIDADHDYEYQHHEYGMHPGEVAVYLTHEEYDQFESHEELHHHLAKKIGFEKAPEPHETRHVHVDHNGNVVNVIEADPSCGDDGEHLGKGHKLISHHHAEVGWRLLDGELIK